MQKVDNSGETKACACWGVTVMLWCNSMKTSEAWLYELLTEDSLGGMCPVKLQTNQQLI